MTAFPNGPIAADDGPAGGDTPVPQPDVAISNVAISNVAISNVVTSNGGLGTAAALALSDLDTSEIEIAQLEDAPVDVAVAEPGDDELSESGRAGHLRVAPEVERGFFHGRRRAQLLVFGVAAVSAASMFLLVTFHVFAAQSAFALNKLDTQLTKEQRDYGHLRAKVATLSSPDAVASRAQRLGMVRSTEVTQLHPLSAPAFAPNDSLPVPPPTPYEPLDDNTGQ